MPKPPPWQGSSSHGFPPATRARILRRDPVCRCSGCRYHVGLCAAPSTDADHVVSVARGGSHDLGNGQGLCRRCHQAKTTREAIDARTGAPRRREPEKHPGMRR